MSLRLWLDFRASVDPTRCFFCGASPTPLCLPACPSSLSELMGMACVPALDVPCCSDECFASIRQPSPWWAVGRWLAGGEQIDLFGRQETP